MLLTVIDHLVIAPEDPIFADLDNKGASVPCNSSGSTTSEQSVETRVSMYKGNEKQTITAIACKIGSSYALGSEYAAAGTPSPAINFKVSTTPSTGYVKVFVKSGTGMSTPTVITITVTATIDGESVSRDVTLTISGNKAGNDGAHAVEYEIRSSVDSITIAANNTEASLNVSLEFWKKTADNNPEAYECYYALYRRKGTSYTRLSYNTSKASLKAYSGISTTVDGVISDAFVVFIGKNAFSANNLGSVAPTTYQAKKEILINKMGDTGPGGEVFSIMSGMGSITIGANTQTGSFTATVSFYKKIGSAARQAYSCFCSVFRKKGSSYYFLGKNGTTKATNWYAEGISVNASTCDALVFCIFDAVTEIHSGYLAELEIPVHKHGDTGPTYWPSGVYDNDATYEKTAQRTPLVFVEDESMSVWNEYAQAYGEYWYLTAETNVVNNVHYAPVDGSSYWAKAVNYGVLMVGAQFARFAKNGAGIMAGDYYYSANGRINGVERVDGVGADGNAVSANNPPAYTRFMGDPFTQNGYFNRTNLSGPVSGDKLQLQTIQITRGVTLNASIKGRTTNDTTKYAYFYIYKINSDGTKTQKAYGWIYKTIRTITLTFTATETGEYSIEYYGQDASTVSTFYGFWELSGHFYPNWWVNLKTGKMCGAKDDFVIGSDGIKVNGAMMTHKVKLQTKLSKYITFPDHAAYEDDYWDSNGDVYLYEAEDNGLPVRIYSDPDAIYYGLRNCKLKYDQVYVGVVAETGKRGRVVIYLPPPHLFIGQRITITNNTLNFPSGSDVSGVFLQMDYMLYTRTDYSEGICLTGQDAYFEDDGTGDQDGNGKNGKPYICNVPERGGAGAIPACGIWMGEVSESQLLFFTALVDEMNIEDYEWIELTSMRGYYAERYEGTAYWESTMNYNAYWMLTRWKKKDE